VRGSHLVASFRSLILSPANFSDSNLSLWRIAGIIRPIMSELASLVGNADEFPILREWTFFNHAGVAPITHSAAEAMRRFAAQAERTAYLDSGWYADLERLRQSAASLINAHRDEIAFIKNTSEGISIVANGIDWQWGDRIITTNVEYPANIYPWMEVARAHGTKLIMVEETIDANGRRVVPIEKILEQAAEPRTRLVTLSHVEFASGQRHDIARIGEFCRQRGILFCVDAIQTLGVIPVDVQAMNIDYLAADGHKWMLGPEGAGIFYIRRDLLERTRPLMIGWLNVINPLEYGTYDYTLKSDAGRFECGSYNVGGLLALKASIELLQRVGIDKIFDRMKLLTDRLAAGLQEKGYEIVSPRALGQWSGIVAFKSKSRSHEEIFKRLRKEHRIEIAVREKRLRASPHFYNTEQQIDRLLDALPPA
jgi:cysteine desulfurase/selenocysteine lyase